jgi:hypothetical protein
MVCDGPSPVPTTAGPRQRSVDKKMGQCTETPFPPHFPNHRLFKTYSNVERKMSDLNILPHLLKLFSEKQLITHPAAVSPTPSQLRTSQYHKLAVSNFHACINTSPHTYVLMNNILLVCMF